MANEGSYPRPPDSTQPSSRQLAAGSSRGSQTSSSYPLPRVWPSHSRRSLVANRQDDPSDGLYKKDSPEDPKNVKVIAPLLSKLCFCGPLLIMVVLISAMYSQRNSLPLPAWSGIFPPKCEPKIWSLPCRHFSTVDKLVSIYHRTSDDNPARITTENFFNHTSHNDYPTRQGIQILFNLGHRATARDLDIFIFKYIPLHLDKGEVRLENPQFGGALIPGRHNGPQIPVQLKAFELCRETNPITWPSILAKPSLWKYGFCRVLYHPNSRAWTEKILRDWTADIARTLLQESSALPDRWLAYEIQPAQRRLARLLDWLKPIFDSDPNLLTYSSIQSLLFRLRHIEIRLVLLSATIHVQHAGLESFSKFLPELHNRSMAEWTAHRNRPQNKSSGYLDPTGFDKDFLEWQAYTWIPNIQSELDRFRRQVSPQVRKLAIRRFEIETWRHCAVGYKDDCRFVPRNGFLANWYRHGKWIGSAEDVVHQNEQELLQWPGVLNGSRMSLKERRKRGDERKAEKKRHGSGSRVRDEGLVIPEEWEGRQCVSFGSARAEKGGRWVGTGPDPDGTAPVGVKDEKNQTLVWCDDFDPSWIGAGWKYARLKEWRESKPVSSWHTPAPRPK